MARRKKKQKPRTRRVGAHGGWQPRVCMSRRRYVRLVKRAGKCRRKLKRRKHGSKRRHYVYMINSFGHRGRRVGKHHFVFAKRQTVRR